MARKPTRKETPEHSQRKQPLGVSSLWDEVPDSLIVALVRNYASMGDAILFGTSADRQVAAIRVYRAGRPYSVYFHSLEKLDYALDLLDRNSPAMRKVQTVSSWEPPAVQVKPSVPKAGYTWLDALNDESVRTIEDMTERNKAFARKCIEMGINGVARR